MIVGSVLLIVVAVGLLVGGIVDGSNPLIIGSMATTVLAAIVLVVGVRQSADVDEDETPADNTPTQVFASPFRDGGRRGRWDRFRRGTAETSAASSAQAPAASSAEADTASAVGAGVEPGRTPAGESSGRGPIPTQAAREAAAAKTSDIATSGTAASGTATSDTQASDQHREPTTEHHSSPPTTAPHDGEPSDVDATGAADVVDAGDDDFDEIPDDEPPEEPVTEEQAARVAMLQNEVLVIDGRPRYHLSDCVHLLRRQEAEPLPVSEARELGFGPCKLCTPDAKLLAEASQV